MIKIKTTHIDVRKGWAWRHFKIRPIAKDELGSEVISGGLRVLKVKDNTAVDFKKELEIWTQSYDFGKHLSLHRTFLEIDNFYDVVDEIAARGCTVNIWGFVPAGDPSISLWCEYSVSDERHRYLMKKLGRRFHGYDNGEQDGRYVSLYAPRWCPAPRSKKEAFEKFMEFFLIFYKKNRNYLTTLNSLTYLHYFARMEGTLSLGVENIQALLSTPMWYAFVRGAARQYGYIFGGGISIFNRWGYKCYSKDVYRKHPDDCGPDKGPSLSLLNRMWYVLYMYGCSYISYEGGMFENFGYQGEPTQPAECEVDKLKLTPIGKMNLINYRWSKENPDRGIQFTPAGLILDFYHGWNPPRHLYSKNYYLTWGTLPYTRGDFQIDAFFRAVFPSYQDCSFFHDERGYITPTPFGDIFDVLLNDADLRILCQYNILILLGDIKISAKLLRYLKSFVQQGGDVVIFANQFPEGAEGFRGLSIGRKSKKGAGAVFGKKRYSGDRFTYFTSKLHSAKAIIKDTKNNVPLVCKNGFGKGTVYTVLISEGITYFDGNLMNIRAGEDEPLTSPCRIPSCLLNFFSMLFEKHHFLKVDPPGIQFITNIFPDNDRRFLLYLGNNSKEYWKGAVILKESKLEKVEFKGGSGDWGMAGNKIKIELSPESFLILNCIIKDNIFNFS